MAHIQWDDKEKLTDALSSEKYLTEDYNAFTSEAATPEVKCCLQNILCEEHDISHGLFCEMSERGWYATEKAEENKINTTKQKFAAMA